MRKTGKKKLGLIAAATAFCLALALFGVPTAGAAVKTTVVTDTLLRSGNFNNGEWERIGADTSAYTVLSGDQNLRYASSAQGYLNYFLAPAQTVADASEDVALEFDLEGIVTTDAYWIPYAWSAAWGNVAANLSSGKFIYGGYAYGGFPQMVAGQRYQFLYKPNGDLKVSTAEILSDGVYGEMTEAVTQTGFSVPEENGPYYFGFIGHQGSAGTMDIDNFAMKRGSATVCSSDFSSDEGLGFTAANQDGKITVGMSTTFFKVSELLVTQEPVSVDANVEESFDVEASLRFDTLADGDKVGFALGLGSKTEALAPADNVFVYVENTAGATSIKADGASGAAVPYGKNIADGAFTDISLTAYSDGRIVFKAGSVSAAFTAEQSLAGYIAIDQVRSSAMAYAVASSITIKGYSYRGSTGDARAVNFNTGWLNGDDFQYESYNAAMIVDEDRPNIKGIVQEDGELFFCATADMSNFTFKDAYYADFILEFDFISIPKADRLRVEPTWLNQYSALGLLFNANIPNWGSHGKAIYIYDIIDPRQETTDSRVLFHSWNSDDADVSKQIATIDGDTGTAASGGINIYKQTTKFKLVAANNRVTLYACAMEPGKPLSEYESSDYIQLIDTAVSDTYGMVSFATTDSGFFKLDNIKITPVDSTDPAVVAENVAAYEDFLPIKDESKLSAPSVALSGDSASWAAVPNASGYRISVNGVESDVAADVLSYDFGQAEPGDYTLTVKAIGGETDDAIRRDSDFSNEVAYGKSAPGTDPGPGGEEPGGEEPGDGGGETGGGEKTGQIGCKGCGNAAAALAATVGVLGIAVLKKRR